MSRPRAWLVPVLALALVWVVPAAAIMVQVSMDQLVASSSSIVRGKVTDLNSHWTDDHAIIVTDVKFLVSEVWTGTMAPGTTLTLQVRGGEVGEIGMRQEHQPVFSKDQEALLFLTESSGARYAVNFDEQGAYKVQGNQVVAFDGQRAPLTTFRSVVRNMVRSRQR
jgi:hypothetical protein